MSGIIKLKVELHSTSDNHSRLEKSTTLFFQDKDHYDSWEKQKLGDISIPFVWPHPTQFKNSTEADKVYEKYGSKPNERFFHSDKLDEEYYILFFKSDEKQDERKQILDKLIKNDYRYSISKWYYILNIEYLEFENHF
jgi:hypothetical protein